jgi:8-oxo-dGTP pyrophosphatase MutT (NUDIX family)
VGTGKDEIRAAGGVVWRAGPKGEVEVALIHRPTYDDWSLPKGKLMAGEGELAAALREVEEETGLRCEPGDELGVSRYVDRRGRDKLVRYWSMRPLGGQFRPTPEVDEVRWVPVPEAVDVLTYDHDRDLLRAFDPGAER